MRRGLLICMVLLLTLGSIAVGCAPKEEVQVPKEFVPCEIKLDSVYNLFAGKESITTVADFSIFNPNEFLVTVDELEYQLYVNGALVSGAQLSDDMYIPAKKEAKVSMGVF